MEIDYMDVEMRNEVEELNKQKLKEKKLQATVQVELKYKREI